jgi:hypothetical protein
MKMYVILDKAKPHTENIKGLNLAAVIYTNASQPPGRGPVVGPGINYTGPREALLEFAIFIF